MLMDPAISVYNPATDLAAVVVANLFICSLVQLFNCSVSSKRSLRNWLELFNVATLRLWLFY